MGGFVSHMEMFQLAQINCRLIDRMQIQNSQQTPFIIIRNHRQALIQAYEAEFFEEATPVATTPSTLPKQNRRKKMKEATKLKDKQIKVVQALTDPQTPQWTEPLFGGEEGWLQKPITEGIRGEKCELSYRGEPLILSEGVSLEHRSNLPAFPDCQEFFL